MKPEPFKITPQGNNFKDGGNMEEIKLLPCPFCGKEPNKRKQIVDHDTMFKVSCEYINCYAQPETILQPTEEFATQAWNNRVPKQV